jgi:hypothetical protein
LSHLTILPTVLADSDCLSSTLESLGFQPLREGRLESFGGAGEPVDVEITLPDGQRIGWTRQNDGCLALVGDLQRISRSHQLQHLLGRITRAYAARMALRDAARSLPNGMIHLSA